MARRHSGLVEQIWQVLQPADSIGNEPKEGSDIALALAQAAAASAAATTTTTQATPNPTPSDPTNGA
ncbi:hypothetical protein Moror_9175 [Moniliophthora roreri MCA 2997]|uniref:Uncharacterized protein n=1 Tax=Moniliophthora roreri (strain MCA 2997) TaxID=1381753 RepID=V2XMB1_MONRO|nr:hypothetical protein Moror_9175 [Moniliophthora roreri MCA 2997]